MSHFIIKSILIMCVPFLVLSKTLNYETTRTKSTAGAGVGSVLMNEATVLNPAPLAFFNVSSIYFEKYTSESEVDSTKEELDNYAFIASDASKNLKGSIAYIKTSDDNLKNKQFNVALASLITEKSSMGFSYNDVRKQYRYKNKIITKNYKLYNVGVFHAISETVTLGVVAIDPLRKFEEESKVMIGGQYQFKSFVTFMLDIGADYKQDLNDSFIYKTAAQFRIYNDFYIRFGTFDDKKLKERGNGLGAGWIQPRLVIDFAIKNTEIKADLITQQEDEKITESSFSLALKF